MSQRDALVAVAGAALGAGALALFTRMQRDSSSTSSSARSAAAATPTGASTDAGGGGSAPSAAASASASAAPLAEDDHRCEDLGADDDPSAANVYTDASLAAAGAGAGAGAKPGSHATYASFTLTYFDIWARGETSRLMFAYAGVPFRDRRVDRDSFAALKAAGRLPFGQVPVLEVRRHDGTVVRFAQSGSIVRFLAANVTPLTPAPLGSLYPSDPLEVALADSLYNMAEDLTAVNPMIHIFRHLPDPRKLEAHAGPYMAALPSRLGFLSTLVAERGGPFLLGSRPTYGDVHLFQATCALLQLAPTALDAPAHAPLRRLRAAVAELPGIREALARRRGPGVLPPKKPPADKK